MVETENEVEIFSREGTERTRGGCHVRILRAQPWRIQRRRHSGMPGSGELLLLLFSIRHTYLLQFWACGGFRFGAPDKEVERVRYTDLEIICRTIQFERFRGSLIACVAAALEARWSRDLGHSRLLVRFGR